MTRRNPHLNRVPGTSRITPFWAPLTWAKLAGVTLSLTTLSLAAGANVSAQSAEAPAIKLQGSVSTIPQRIYPANIAPRLPLHPAPGQPVLNNAAPVNSIARGGYTLVAWTDEQGQLQNVAGAAAPTLQLDGRQMSGNAGCNRYGGTYAAREQTLRFGRITSTMIGCSAPLAQQEQRYHKLLSQVGRYALQGDTLTLFAGAKDRLVFRQQRGQGEVSGGSIRSNLDGKWQIVGVSSPMGFTLRGSDISGNDGCNQFAGKVNFSGSLLRLVGPVSATRMACPPDSLSLYTMLGDGRPTSTGTGATYQVRGNTLTLSAGNQTWHFERR